MNPETNTMENETQTAADTNENLQQETVVDAAVSETEAPIENESQAQSQEETPATDDQPVTAPTVAKASPAAEMLDRETLLRERGEMQALVRQMAELHKSELESKAQERAQKSATPKGSWKETLAKAYKPEDANVLSGAIEAALAERLEGLDRVKQEMDFYKPHIEKLGVDREIDKGATFMQAEGVPASVVAKLRGEVEKMVQSGYRAPVEVMFQAAHAKELMKQSKAHATKTLAARNAATAKPQAPAPKNTAGAVAPKYADKATMEDFLAQFEQYK